MKKETSYGVVPIYRLNDEDIFLVIKHKAGHWAFPKGHPKTGENEKATALRELEEETGLNDVINIQDETITDSYITKHFLSEVEKTVTYYVGYVITTDLKLQAEEVVGSAWLTYPRALHRITYESTKEVIKKAKVILEE